MTGLATRTYQDDKGRYVVAWERNRRTFTRTFAEYNTAQAIAQRIQDSGSPTRGFTS